MTDVSNITERIGKLFSDLSITMAEHKKLLEVIINITNISYM